MSFKTMDIQKADCSDNNGKQISVFLRIRPLINNERKDDVQCWKIIDYSTIQAVAPKESFAFKSRNCENTFAFDRVFGSDVGQGDFFCETVGPSIPKLINDGTNILVFSFGVSGGGKTYTMQGSEPSASGTWKEEGAGILSRAVTSVFDGIDGRFMTDDFMLKPSLVGDVVLLTEMQVANERRDVESLLSTKLLSKQQNSKTVDASRCSQLSDQSVSMVAKFCDGDKSASSAKLSSCSTEYFDAADRLSQELSEKENLCGISPEHMKFSVWVSFAEIYNECIYDLLPANKLASHQTRPTLSIGQDRRGKAYIKDLNWLNIKNVSEILSLFSIGHKRLQHSATKLNSNSSRSHGIFTVKIVRAVGDDPKTASVTIMSFCDLAGTERVVKSETQGKQLREACQINKSLHTLGRVLASLKNRSCTDSALQVPFRDSKLTFLFQPYLVGQSSIFMIVNVSPHSSVFDETLHVLRFSSVAKYIILRPEESATSDLVILKPSELSEGNTKLKRKLEELSTIELTGESIIISGETSKADAADALAPLPKRFCEDASEIKELVNDLTTKELSTASNNELSLILKLQDEINQLTRQLKETQQNAVAENNKLRFTLGEEFSSMLLETERYHRDQMESMRRRYEDLMEDRLQLLRRAVYEQIVKPKRHGKRKGNEQASPKLTVDETDLNAQLDRVMRRVSMLSSTEVRACLSNVREQLSVKTAELEEIASTAEEMCEKNETLENIQGSLQAVADDLFKLCCQPGAESASAGKPVDLCERLSAVLSIQKTVFQTLVDFLTENAQCESERLSFNNLTLADAQASVFGYVTKMAQQLSSLESRLVTLNSENSLLENKSSQLAEALQCSQKNSELLLNEKSLLHQENCGLQDVIIMLRDEQSTFIQNVKDLTKELQTNKEQCELLQEKVTHIDLEKASAYAEIERLRCSLEEQQKTVDQKLSRSPDEEMSTEIAANSIASITQLETVTAENSNLQDQNKQLADECQKLQNQFNQLYLAHSQFDQLTSDYEKTVQELKLENDQLILQLNDAKEQIAKLSEDYADMQQEVALLQKRNQELTEERDKLHKNYNFQCDRALSLSASVEELTDKLCAAQAAASEQSCDLIKTLESKTDNLQRELIAVRQQLQESSLEVSRLQEQLRASEHDRVQKEPDLDNQQATTASCNDELDESKKQLEKALNDTVQLQRQLDKVQAQNERLAMEKERLHKDYSIQFDKAMTLSLSVQELTDKLAEAQAKARMMDDEPERARSLRTPMRQSARKGRRPNGDDAVTELEVVRAELTAEKRQRQLAEEAKRQLQQRASDTSQLVTRSRTRRQLLKEQNSFTGTDDC